MNTPSKAYIVYMYVHKNLQSVEEPFTLSFSLFFPIHLINITHFLGQQEALIFAVLFVLRLAAWLKVGKSEYIPRLVRTLAHQ